jgi:hypothetical protein
MGILTRRQDNVFVITSDRTLGASPTARAPARLPEDYQVWTGQRWSTTQADAVTFASLEAADEYVRANFSKVTEK